MQRTRLLLSLLGLLGLLAGLFPVAMGAYEGPEAVGPTETIVVRIHIDGREHLDQVAGELDIWEVHYEAGYAVALVTPKQYSWLETLGYRPEVDEEKTIWLGVQSPLDPRFHYYDDYYYNQNERYLMDFLIDVSFHYPQLISVVDIGDAWLSGRLGEHHRNILVLRITNENPAYGPIEDKPAFYLFGGIHAREVVIPELVIRYSKYLTSGYDGEGGYGIDPDVTWLVDHNVLYALVMQNPDGHWVNEQDIANNRRKNMDDDDGCNDPSTWGVDLNRNHSFFWGCCGGSSGAPCTQTYRGPERASEPETQAFQAHFTSVMQDQNGPNGDDELPPAAPITATGIFISLHSYSDLILWPWGFDPGNAPNEPQLRTIARKLATFNDYDPNGTIYTVDGCTDDWTYGKFGIASFTYEVGPAGGTCGGFFPPYGCIEGESGYTRNFWAENKPSFIYSHKIARTPYMTVYGPDSEDVRATPPVVASGSWLRLSATIVDRRYNDDPLHPIAAAEYLVDAPGEGGTGVPMLPVDGSWGDLSEEAELVIDAATLPTGTHYFLVHGQNDQGDWGPFTAVFVTVEEGPCQPVEIWDVLTETAGCQVTFTAELTGTAFFDYYWEWRSFSSDEPIPSVILGESGTYTYTLAVTNCGGTDTFSGSLSVDCCTAAYGADLSWTPPDPLAGEIINFSASASGTEPLTFSWDLGDGNLAEGKTVTHSYALDRDYVIVMTASNECGMEIITHSLGLCGGVQGVDLIYAPAEPIFNHPLVFSASVSGTAPFSYSWDLGDGYTAAGMTTTHAYTLPGSYTVWLTVSNCAGQAMEGIVRTLEVGAYWLYLPLVVK